MKVVEINSCPYGSTGKIMLKIAEVARKNNIDITTFSSAWRTKRKDIQGHYYFGGYMEHVFHATLARITGLNGSFSYFSTINIIKKLKLIKPDIIHLHNIHGFCINFKLLFDYIKKNNIKVVWTLHDCWTFTGRCPYFLLTKCDKWINGCFDCTYPKSSYPACYIDNSKYMWKKKKNIFTSVDNMVLVTPSKWLMGLVKRSYLKDYDVKVINNGIDLNIFKPTPSDFRQKYNLVNKRVILGVAFGWEYRKGLDVFIELEKRLGESYKIVLVGTDDKIDDVIPKSIISIHRTENQKQLAEIYSACDVFVNPTREDNYPTVNMESLSCGTPVISFDTGGSSEIIDDTCGCVVPCDNINLMEQKIIEICSNNLYPESCCVAKAKNFDCDAKFLDYIDLYNKLS